MRIRVHLIVLVSLVAALSACMASTRKGPRGPGSTPDARPTPTASGAPDGTSVAASTGTEDGIIGPRMVVTCRFRLTDDRGDLVDETPEDELLSYLHGIGYLLPGIERALEGRHAGDSFEVEFGPGEVFGDRGPAAGHELAAHSLLLTAEILAVRPATPEEIEHRHAHGPGGAEH